MVLFVSYRRSLFMSLFCTTTIQVLGLQITILFGLKIAIDRWRENERRKWDRLFEADDKLLAESQEKLDDINRIITKLEKLN